MFAGINLHNKEKIFSPAAFNLADAAQALTLVHAGTRLWYGAQHNNSHEMKAGLKETYGLFGSVGVGQARRAGKKPVRLPKQMVFRHALNAGP